MSEMKNIFAVEADDKSLAGKSSGVFGLNKGNITKFAFNDKAGTGGTDGNAVDMTVTTNGREYYNRFFLNLEVYGKDNNLLKPGEEGYDVAFFNHYSQIIAVIKHGLGSLGISKEAMNTVLTGMDNTKLVDGIQKLLSLVPNGFESKDVDVFLEYQWKISDGQDRTFLQLPKTMKGGEFLIPSVSSQGSWKEVRTGEGLSYVDDSGNKHPFTRTESFMESPKGTQQGAGAANVAQDVAASVEDAAKSGWGA